jgi:hypothetical protein
MMAAALKTPSGRIRPGNWRLCYAPDHGLALHCRECRGYDTRKGKKRARPDGFSAPGASPPAGMAFGSIEGARPMSNVTQPAVFDFAAIRSALPAEAVPSANSRSEGPGDAEPATLEQAAAIEFEADPDAAEITAADLDRDFYSLRLATGIAIMFMRLSKPETIESLNKIGENRIAEVLDLLALYRDRSSKLSEMIGAVEARLLIALASSAEAQP